LGHAKFQWISCLKTRRTEPKRTLAFKSPKVSSTQAPVCFMPILKTSSSCSQYFNWISLTWNWSLHWSIHFNSSWNRRLWKNEKTNFWLL